MTSRTTWVALAIVTLAAGCPPTPKSGRGFTLPQGDVEQGKAVYLKLHCHACHTMPGVEQLPPAIEGDAPSLSIALGGEVGRIQSYGELVTAVINPSHRFAKGYPWQDVSIGGESKMLNFNDIMTVQQLADLVTYLQSNYKLRPYEPTDYPPFY